MTDETNGAAAAAATPQPAQQPPRMQILNQFVRDLSFENIAVQKGQLPEGKPEIKVQINLDAQPRGTDHYDVGLKVKVDSTVSGAPLFILELDYAGRFVIQNVPHDQMHALMMIECPRLIFPFVRRVVADVTRDGGYPPLNLEMIDFLQLYRNEVARRQSESAGETSTVV